jgi:hypothetical protein
MKPSAFIPAALLLAGCSAQPCPYASLRGSAPTSASAPAASISQRSGAPLPPVPAPMGALGAVAAWQAARRARKRVNATKC